MVVFINALMEKLSLVVGSRGMIKSFCCRWCCFGGEPQLELPLLPLPLGEEEDTVDDDDDEGSCGCSFVWDG